MNPHDLKLIRIRKGLRQYQVAAAVGIAPCRLSEIESGRRQPSLELLGQILAVIEKTSSIPERGNRLQNE